ncbi:hypothetical protein AXF42_Ash019427 [Apostasia shenzhenica]|uniref:Uncharacterized protein n=1 Tax=Apostasia shenzhenica TaxID=1088818 RepID=A0A2I0B4W9_9ASPA|nr:hypothetical protein AXF42_Ash019427 [Apostasia shenzhenica]
MVARTRRTNSASRSIHAGEPSVWAPDDRASASTSSVMLNLLPPPKAPVSQNFRGCS